MKRIHVLLVLAFLVLASCSRDDKLSPAAWERFRVERADTITVSQRPHFTTATTVRLLGVGNSWTMNCAVMLGYLLNDMGVKIEIGLAMRGAASLEQYADWIYNQSRELYFYRFHNGVWEINNKERFTYDEILRAEQWDIVTLQQFSGRAGQYATYQPFLRYILHHTQQTLVSRPTFVLNATWSYPWNVPAQYDYSSAAMYRANLRAYDQAMRDEHIHYIMPCAPAIQQLRQWEDVTGVDEADGAHLDKVGRYAVACVWAEMLLHHLLNWQDAPCITEGSLVFDGISPELGARIRRLAHEVVENRRTYFPACR